MVKERLEASIEPSKKSFRKWRIKFKRRTFRQRLVRNSVLAANILVVLIVIVFVLQKPASTAAATNLASDVNVGALNSLAPNPLDQVASANIALTVAQMSNLPETTPIDNQAESQQAELAMASTSDNIISKPQVTETALKSRADITNYIVQNGDTVASIAAKFDVTTNSILWSNDIAGGSVIVGEKLVIPPVNGIVYIVKAGDTPASLAQTYQANESQIIAYNDAEISGIYTGEQIIIPNGTAPSSNSSSSIPIADWVPAYGSNGYDYGYCTWFVASQIAVPNNWGNASSWSYYASVSGWNVSSTPQVGSIAQTPFAAGGEGHVAIVVAVNGDQVEIKDMNGLAGWGKVGEGWEPVSEFPNYITH